MPPKAPRTQVLERYKVEREDGAPLFADCTAPDEPLRTIPLGSTVVMLEEHTPQHAGKGGGVSGDAEPWIHIVGYTPLLLPLQSCDGWVRKSHLVACGERSLELNGSVEPFECRRDTRAGHIMITFRNRSSARRGAATARSTTSPSRRTR